MNSKKRDEIRNKALKFVAEHQDYKDEKQQSQMWLRDLFVDVFGISKIKVNVGFEHKVKGGYIDHLFNKLLITEMKSLGKDLDKAKQQAFGYIKELSDEDEPRYVMVSDFKYIRLYDLKNNTHFQFQTEELPLNVELFDFLFEEEIVAREPQSPVNKKAAQKLEKLHHKLRDLNYPKNARALLMTRVVFCMFSDDTNIFEKDQFKRFIENETKEDGTDLIAKLIELFSALNTPENERWHTGPARDFRYINGGLFKIDLPIIVLDKDTRDMLLEIAELDWSMISPIIFGSMFEGAMDEKSRHDLGTHFTSELNIMKVISSLFLDELYEELDLILKLKVGRLQKLKIFHEKLSKLKFLDPACGSGNFLLLAYREIRRLEHEVVQAELREEYIRENKDTVFTGFQDTLFSIEDRINVEVAQFYGIEIQAYAVSIAKLGLWLMDHLMNLEASNKFGQQILRLPLHDGANITRGNALVIDWNEVIKPSELNYILGNPPFLGSAVMSEEQKKELVLVGTSFKKIKKLDYVAGWYIKSANFMLKNPAIRTALVSTNSIVQGEQPIALWKDLFSWGIKINFCHQTFNWDNNGANVFVVIIGFSMVNNSNKKIFKYENINKEPISVNVKNINEYLSATKPLLLEQRNQQIDGFPKMERGSQPTDGGNFILSKRERQELIDKYGQKINPYIRPFIGARELLHNEERWILYLKDLTPKELKDFPEIIERIKKVSEVRKASKSKATQEFALRPLELQQDKAPKGDILVVPKTSSIRREYIPMDFRKYPTIPSDLLFQIEDGSLLLLGLLETHLHMVWAKTVGGRLKSDFRYSNTLVYNTFPFPNLNEENKSKIEVLTQSILDIREYYYSKDNSLADLYDPLLMPIELRKAHKKLDIYVESLYSKHRFLNDEERLDFLINEYLKRKSRKK